MPVPCMYGLYAHFAALVHGWRQQCELQTPPGDDFFRDSKPAKFMWCGDVRCGSFDWYLSDCLNIGGEYPQKQFEHVFLILILITILGGPRNSPVSMSDGWGWICCKLLDFPLIFLEVSSHDFLLMGTWNPENHLNIRKIFPPSLVPSTGRLVWKTYLENVWDTFLKLAHHAGGSGHLSWDTRYWVDAGALELYNF